MRASCLNSATNNRLQALYFVRHGESQDNSAYIWSRRDTPLTDKGRAQALEAAKNKKTKTKA
jgi:broad specificity phosphatase PhoE